MCCGRLCCGGGKVLLALGPAISRLAAGRPAGRPALYIALLGLTGWVRLLRASSRVTLSIPGRQHDMLTQYRQACCGFCWLER